MNSLELPDKMNFLELPDKMNFLELPDKMNFLELPDDILLEIFKYLKDKDCITLLTASRSLILRAYQLPEYSARISLLLFRLCPVFNPPEFSSNFNTLDNYLRVSIQDGCLQAASRLKNMVDLVALYAYHDDPRLPKLLSILMVAYKENDSLLLWLWVLLIDFSRRVRNTALYKTLLVEALSPLRLLNQITSNYYEEVTPRRYSPSIIITTLNALDALFYLDETSAKTYLESLKRDWIYLQTTEINASFWKRKEIKKQNRQGFGVCTYAFIQVIHPLSSAERNLILSNLLTEDNLKIDNAAGLRILIALSRYASTFTEAQLTLVVKRSLSLLKTLRPLEEYSKIRRLLKVTMRDYPKTPQSSVGELFDCMGDALIQVMSDAAKWTNFTLLCELWLTLNVLMPYCTPARQANLSYINKIKDRYFKCHIPRALLSNPPQTAFLSTYYYLCQYFKNPVNNLGIFPEIRHDIFQQLIVDIRTSGRRLDRFEHILESGHFSINEKNALKHLFLNAIEASPQDTNILILADFFMSVFSDEEKEQLADCLLNALATAPHLLFLQFEIISKIFNILNHLSGVMTDAQKQSLYEHAFQYLKFSNGIIRDSEIPIWTILFGQYQILPEVQQQQLNEVIGLHNVRELNSYVPRKLFPIFYHRSPETFRTEFLGYLLSLYRNSCDFGPCGEVRAYGIQSLIILMLYEEGATSNSCLSSLINASPLRYAVQLFKPGPGRGSLTFCSPIKETNEGGKLECAAGHPNSSRMAEA